MELSGFLIQEKDMKEYNITIGGNDYNVVVKQAEDGRATIVLDSEEFEVSYAEKKQEEAPKVSAAASITAAAVAPSGGKTVVSPLPGVIVDICVKDGQAIKCGDKLAVIEAMKMENEILAECDGNVSAIHVSKGDSVLEGAKIVTIG